MGAIHCMLAGRHPTTSLPLAKPKRLGDKRYYWQAATASPKSQQKVYVITNTHSAHQPLMLYRLAHAPLRATTDCNEHLHAPGLSVKRRVTGCQRSRLAFVALKNGIGTAATKRAHGSRPPAPTHQARTLLIEQHQSRPSAPECHLHALDLHCVPGCALATDPSRSRGLSPGMESAVYQQAQARLHTDTLEGGNVLAKVLRSTNETQSSTVPFHEPVL